MISLFESWVYFKAGNRRRAVCNELNDFHLKVLSERLIIMRVSNAIGHMPRPKSSLTMSHINRLWSIQMPVSDYSFTSVVSISVFRAVLFGFIIVQLFIHSELLF